MMKILVKYQWLIFAYLVSNLFIQSAMFFGHAPFAIHTVPICVPIFLAFVIFCVDKFEDQNR